MRQGQEVGVGAANPAGAVDFMLKRLGLSGLKATDTGHVDVSGLKEPAVHIAVDGFLTDFKPIGIVDRDVVDRLAALDDYINKLLESGCLFGGVFHRERLISIASAYPEKDLCRCELTDCATLPDYRGLSLTERILMLLEKEIKDKGPLTLYSLARARSYGMNRVFHKLDYKYQGRLINNCCLSGGFEDMNLWVKV